MKEFKDELYEDLLERKVCSLGLWITLLFADHSHGVRK